jgi:hypothetical protein
MLTAVSKIELVKETTQNRLKRGKMFPEEKGNIFYLK